MLTQAAPRVKVATRHHSRSQTTAEKALGISPRCSCGMPYHLTHIDEQNRWWYWCASGRRWFEQH